VETELVRRAYAAVAELYIELFGTRQQVHADDLALIARHLATGPGPVLDLGCGPGHLTDHLRSLGVDAVGIDPVGEFIAHARAAHPAGVYELGSIEDLPERPVAGILAWYSLIHLPPAQVDGVLAKFRRMLDPAGTLVVGIFTGAEVAAFDHKVATAYRWPVDEFAERLTRAGFTEVERLPRPDPSHRTPPSPRSRPADTRPAVTGRVSRRREPPDPETPRRRPRRRLPRRSPLQLPADPFGRLPGGGVEEDQAEELDARRRRPYGGQRLRDGVLLRPAVHAGRDEREGDRRRAELAGERERGLVAAAQQR
jgi:SAM-dependent methyltransferase